MLYSGQGANLREDLTYTARDQQSLLTRCSNLAATVTVGTTSMGYDAVGRLTNLQHKDASAVNIANYTHTYDAASRVTTEKLNAGATTTYQYDSTDQLTNDAVVTYSYDANGNRTMSGYSTGPNNQLTSDGAWNYYADKNGNITQKIKPSTGEIWNFGYDNRNRLTTVTDTTSSGLQMQGTYTHDALGQRVQKAVWTASSGTTTTTRFAYDQRQIIADLDGSSALTMRYLLGTRILERLARVSSAGTVAWLLADYLGSIRNVVNAGGSTIDTALFDGFGNIVSQSSPANGGAYLWAGYRFDPETGFYLPDTSVFRYYEPPIGRWRSVDLLRIDRNWWLYVENNPTNVTDPIGLNPSLELAAVKDLLPGGKPGRNITWKVDFGKPIPKGVTQNWIVSKIEVWSIYAPGGKGMWQVHPGSTPPGAVCGSALAAIFPVNFLVETKYKADYDPLRGPLLDDDNIGFDKAQHQWAFYFIRVDKSIGFGNGRKLGTSVDITEPQANKDEREMGATISKGAYDSTYIFIDQESLRASGIDLQKAMPKNVKDAYERLARRAKLDKIDLATFSGAVLYVPVAGKVYSLPKKGK